MSDEKNDLNTRLDLVTIINDDAICLMEFIARHQGTEDPLVIYRSREVVMRAVDYAIALAEGRVQRRLVAPKLAILDGGKPKD